MCYLNVRFIVSMVVGCTMGVKQHKLRTVPKEFKSAFSVVFNRIVVNF